MTAKIKLNAASGGGSFSLQAPSSSSNNRVMTLPDTADGTILTTTNPKSGNVIQVVQTVKKDTASQSAGIASPMNFDSVFSKAITPSSSSNKIEVTFNLSVALSTATNLMLFRLRRKIGSGSFADVTDAMGDTAASRYRCMTTVESGANDYMMHCLNLNFLDSPSTTDAVEYSFSVAHDSGSTRTFYLNRADNDTSSYAYVARGISTIILREVAA
jgi:hypothetical protein